MEANRSISFRSGNGGKICGSTLFWICLAVLNSLTIRSCSLIIFSCSICSRSMRRIVSICRFRARLVRSISCCMISNSPIV